MIGADLLNLLYGNPMSQIAQATNPPVMPNPNPNAPPRPQAPMMSPAPASIGGPPGHFETLPDQAGSPHWVPGPAKGPMAPGPPPIGGLQMPQGGPPGGGAPNAPPGPPPGQGGLPPTAATQSPPDLASLYLQLENRNRSANEIDHGLAMMASSFAAPGTQGQIMHSADNMNQDPGAQLSNLISLQNLQRQAANRPNIIAALTGGAVDPNMAAAYGGMSNEQLQAALQDKMKAQIGLQTDAAKTKQTELNEAQHQAPLMNTQLTQMDSITNQIKTATNADGTPVLQGILSSPAKRIAAERMMEPTPTDPGLINSIEGQIAAAAFTPQEQAALNQMKMLHAQVYGEAFQSTGSRRTGQEVKNLQAGLTPIENFNQSYSDYMNQFNQFHNQLYKSIGNNLGSAGRLDDIPANMRWDTTDPNNPKPMVDSAYLPGGNMYSGGGGQWASSPPKSNFDYATIPSGTVYTAPDGTQRRKP